MTYKEFLDEVNKLNKEWTLDYRGTIVIKDEEDRCPWLAVHDRKRILILDDIKNETIWDAADNKHNYNEQVRQDLLRVCKLEKEIENKTS